MARIEDSRQTDSQRIAPTRAGRILIVDADADTRAQYREALTLAGYQIMEAADGREALVEALMHPPTLVITEIALPFIDGYGLSEVLRRGQKTAHIPILVVTTEARPGHIDRARKAGADVVLLKPTPPDNMLNEARRLLARASDMRGRAAATSANVTMQFETSATVVARSEGRPRTTLSKSFARRATRTPPASPPALVCPSCERLLTYERSKMGGVSHLHLEQWDYYACATCGAVQHRHRTRTSRRVS